MNQTDHELIKALANAGYTHTPQAVWSDSLVHVPAVNTNIASAIRSCVEAVRPEDSENPVGLPIVGTKGSGKTHELANARREVQTAGGIFVHVDSVKAADFWETVRDKLLDSLDQRHTEAETQAQYLIGTLTYKLGLEQPYSKHLMNGTDIRPEHIVQLTKALERNGHRQVKLLRVASALAVMQSDDYEQRAIGFDFLAGNAESQSGDRKRFKLPKTSLSPQDTVRFFSRLAAIVAPTVVGVDQLDVELEDMESGTGAQAANDGSRLGHSLVELRDTMTRTVTIVACQPSVWRRMSEDEANSSVKDRFLPKVSFDELLSPDVAREFVAAHFRPHFESHGFAPPYPTWPVTPEALADAPQFRPRELLKVITDHMRKCVQNEKTVELESLIDTSDAPAVPAPRAADDVHQPLDALFNVYRREAEVSDAFDPATEDETVPTVLTTGLGFAIREQGASSSDWQVVRSNKTASGWHAQVVRDLGDHNENPMMWTIGFLSHTHWKALRSRTRKLRLHSQISPGDERRHAILVRPKPWRNTKTANDTEDEFKRATGQIITDDLSDDLKVFQALRRLESEDHDSFEQWLRERHPASATRIARAVFGEPPGTVSNGPPIEPDPTERDVPPIIEGTPSDEIRPSMSPTVARDDPNRLDFGLGEGRSEPVGVKLEALRKHVAIFAGSGSGKTVLIRRLVEECALRGVSAIVLDPNNDLARLGEPWTDPPTTWLPGDDLLAERYLKETEVVVWTPRREAGRPLSFQPLPDFASVIDDPDEYNQALDTAVSTLAPRARVDKNTAKAEQGRAVLREALRHFSKRPAAMDLAAFIDLLADLPDDIANIDKASSMAHEMAQTLAAAAINDPLFGGSGTPLDPGVLLTPSEGKRARVSVISFIGLADAAQRQSFVNQLQMALFAWIKRHPSTDKPLSGLMVMDEAQTFAPSGAMTTCTESTLALASQARKYGLGLVFATQAPRGIHNRIVGNASTQFFGFLNSPPQIDAAREMARSKSSSVPDISRLSAGQFYAVSEGLRFQKVSVPMCLSHHPASALTTEEVLALAYR